MAINRCIHSRVASRYLGLVAYKQVMPMIIKSRTTHTFSLNGSPEWEVSDAETKDVDGEQFVPLPPRQCSLIRLVVHECNDVPKIVARERPTLGNLPGYKHLIDARNSLQAKEFEPANAGAIALFGAGAPQPPKKKKRRIAEAHTNAVLDVPLPDVVIRMLRAKHPADIMSVSFESVEQAVLFIRHSGIATAMLFEHRAYKSVDAPDIDGMHQDGSKSLIVRNGTRGLLVHLPNSKKTVSCGDMDKAITLLENDATENDENADPQEAESVADIPWD